MRANDMSAADPDRNEDSFIPPAETDAYPDDLSWLMHSDPGMPLPLTKDIPLGRQAIVGMRFQGGAQELLEDLSPGDRITFIREPDNRFDERAVMALDAKGRKLGYIPRSENRVISALMDAGKVFYGTVTETSWPQIRNDRPGGLQGAVFVDLYMREFILPEDISEIPRQGYRGSYAVGAFEMTEKEILGICAIKVINGEERGMFLEEQQKDNSYEAVDIRTMLMKFRDFSGYLPLVSHNISGSRLRILEDNYGLLLGMPFSNRIIDTEIMAENHMPVEDSYELSDLANQLGIEFYDIGGLEWKCRATWELYCRMERSELE